MPHDFIPRRDAQFLAWSRAFITNINAAPPPGPSQFGITVAEAAHYASLHDAFAAAYQIVCDPATRTTPKITAKDEARKILEREARRLSRIIQAATGVTDEQREMLGLTVRQENRSPVAAPAEPPVLLVQLPRGSTVHINLRSNDSNRRGKPTGISGAMIFCYVGETPPSPDSLEQWKLQATTTRPSVEITLSGEQIVPGAKAWFTAYWLNPRNQRGPASEPQYTFIQCPTLMLGNQSLRSPRMAA
jgi:hypothetical protein